MKIGYIDYYLDNWHANHYIRRFESISGGEAKVAYAYGMTANPESGVTSEQWCAEHAVALCRTIEEAVELSDVLYILSPEHGEMHETLARIPLSSGKRTFIDKPFAPDRQTAERIFTLAEQHRTPCYSASALRFASEYLPYRGRAVRSAALAGPGEWENYLIHHLEPLLMLMPGAVRRVMALRHGTWTQLRLEWEDGRCASAAVSGEYAADFSALLRLDDGSASVTVHSDYHTLSIRQMLDFYRTGTVPVSHEETLRVIGVREACLEAAKQCGSWIRVP